MVDIMNLVLIKVTNITYDKPTKYRGLRKLVADIDTEGLIEKQKTLHVTDEEYKMILTKGYFLG